MKYRDILKTLDRDLQLIEEKYSIEEKKKSKISPDLDNLLENKWRLATLKKEYKKKNTISQIDNP